MFSNIPKDKLLHFFYGTLISFGSIGLFGVYGLWITVIVAAAKEIVYDWYLGKGTPDFKDFVITCLPALMFLIIEYNEFI
jgi:hypothetical protein